MMKLLSLILTAGFVLSLGAFDVTSKTVILTSGLTDHPELKAVESLKEHLEKIFGKKMTVKSLKSVKKPVNALILRRDPKLGTEEWLIKTEGKNLIISGGFPRGVYHAVHRFLENYGDVRWFTPFDTRIIKKSVIRFPDKKVFRGTPAFPLRRSIVHGYRSRKASVFFTRHAGSGSYGVWPSNFHFRNIGPTCHTFYLLTKDIPKDKEYMLPVSAQGYRQRAVNGVGPGQVCFSNKEFREYTKKKVREMIAKHEVFFKKYPFLHRPSWTQYIELSQNDNTSFCHCKGCKALTKKYGAVSGGLIEFINDIAGAFPEHKFQTFAYLNTMAPPTGIRARDNVIVQLAFLSSDILRPLSAPTNKEFREYFEKWDKVCKNKSVWCYHRGYPSTESFPWPQACYWNIAEDYRYYQKIGALRLLDESELLSVRAFYDLHIYLSATLGLDPNRDEKKLIEEFFQFQYGPAAPEMKAYAAYLKKRLDAVKGRLNRSPIKSRSCFDEAFFRTIDRLLTRAEAKAAGNERILKLIALERVPVDYAAAYMWDLHGKKAFKSRHALCDRLDKNLRILLDRYLKGASGKIGGVSVKFTIDQQLKTVKILRDPLPIPPGLEKRDVMQLSVMENSAHYNVSDPDAAYGVALKFAKVPPKYPHKPEYVSFVCYDRKIKKVIGGRKIPPAEQKQDEKYHLYYIGHWVPNRFHKQDLRGHRSWILTLTRLYEKVWNPIDPDREYDFYISMKLTGPAYVKGSKKQNAIYVDKLVVVKRDEAKSK